MTPFANQRGTTLRLEMNFRQRKYISTEDLFAEQRINISTYVNIRNNNTQPRKEEVRGNIIQLYSSNIKKYVLNKNFN